jgi:hypothetical protein
MKKTAEEFNKTPVTKGVVTDSDGTMTPFVPLERMQEAKPTPEYLEGMRQASFNNPDTVFMILTGRKNGEGNNIYGDALKPDEEGRQPKIVIATENGAYMQFRPIESDQLMIPASTEGMSQIAEPLSDEMKSRIQGIMSGAAGTHYTEDSNNTSEEKWIRAEVKTYGFTAHYREPSDPAQKEEFNQIKEQIKSEFEALGRETDLEVHLGATSSFTVEKVSKGATIAKLADKNPVLSVLFASQGIVIDKMQSMSFAGDDVGDRAAQKEINDRLEEGTLKGYTLRPSNYTPFDPSHRVPNGPKETVVQDSLYVLGSNEMLPQEIQRSFFIQPETLETLNALREDLSEKGLLPSKNTDDQTPPIVLLTSGDILIQEPERYPQETLENLKDWDKGKVVLLASEENPQSLKIKELARDNANIVAVSPEGAVYQQGEYLDLASSLTAAKADNKITSANESRSEEIQQLRAIQATLVSKGILIPKAIAPAAKQEQPTQEDVKPAAQQEVQSDAQQQEQPAVAQETAAAGRQEPPAEAEAAVVAPPVAQAAETSALGQLAVRPSSPGTVAGRTINRRRGRDSLQQTTQPAKKSRGARM